MEAEEKNEERRKLTILAFSCRVGSCSYPVSTVNEGKQSPEEMWLRVEVWRKSPQREFLVKLSLYQPQGQVKLGPRVQGAANGKEESFCSSVQHSWGGSIFALEMKEGPYKAVGDPELACGVHSDNPGRRGFSTLSTLGSWERLQEKVILDKP